MLAFSVLLPQSLTSRMLQTMKTLSTAITLCLLSMAGMDMPAAAQAPLASQALEKVSPIARPSAREVSLEKLNGVISVHLDDVPLERALQHIARHAGLRLFYPSAKDIEGHRVSLHLEQVTALAALYETIRGLSLSMHITPSGHLIVGVAPEPSGLPEVDVPVVGSIAGRVTDAVSGETLPGVNVMIEGTTRGSATDIDGRYTITGVEEGTYTLVATFIGYSDAIEEDVEVRDGETTEVDFALRPAALGLDEVVVMGYGTTRKENLTGSVSSVSGDALKRIPASRIDQILQGRAAGVEVTQTSGAPGAASTIRIRGGNSIEGNNDPLFVIDGLIVGTNFNLNSLNTNDIKSIEVLKDATAIGIYGTRGANGVVLITTKSGEGVEPGRPQVSIGTYSGVQQMMNTVDFLDGREHALYANEDAEFRNSSLPFPNLDDVPNVDWISQITRPAPISNMDVSVAGTSEERKLSYYVSGNYFNQEGIIRNSGISRFTFRTNLDLNISDKVSAGLDFNAARNRIENNKVNLSAILSGAGLPNRSIRDEDGNYTAVNPVSTNINRNPEADVELRVNRDFFTNVFGNMYVEVEPIGNLVVRSTFGPQVRYTKTNIYNPAMLPEHFIVNEGGDAAVGVSTNLNLLNENTVTYSTRFGADSDLDLLGGFTWQTSETEGVDAASFAFANDALEYNDLATGSDPTRNVVNSGWDSYQLVSWLGRASYSFNNRYLLTLVGRTDGSSRFAGSNNEYGFFPSAAVAWRLDQEPFIRRLGTFDMLKLRASYGLSGSQAIPSFRTLALLSGTSAYFGETEHPAVQTGRPSNRDLRWETTAQFDVGLEAGFFGGRLSLTADYYNKKTEDLLLNVQIPRQTGFTSKLQNLGSIRNQGLEFTIESINLARPSFHWTSAFTISGNRNEVLDLGGVEFIDIVSPTSGGPGGRLIVGESVPVFVGVEYLGTWKSQEEIDESGQDAQQVGGPRFRDTNEDGQVNIADFGVLGSPQPDFSAGLHNSIRFGRVTLDVFIQGTYGNEIYNSVTQSAFFGRPETNKYAETRDRWTPENPDSDIPRAGTVATLASVYSNSKMVEDGSHLRLRNLQVGYDLPVRRWGLSGFNNLNVYFSGSNLILLSGFRLFDPEVSQYGSSNTALGFSQGEYPYGRTLTFGIEATLQ